MIKLIVKRITYYLNWIWEAIMLDSAKEELRKQKQEAKDAIEDSDAAYADFQRKHSEYEEQKLRQAANELCKSGEKTTKINKGTD